MGVIDEHWCSECGKSLDKKKDKYVEVDFINDNKTKNGKAKKKKSDKHNRGFLCEDCFGEDPVLKKKFGEIRLKGNPNFICSIECKHYAKCPTYEYRNKNVRCKHIAVIDDKVYCKRRHPGSIKLMQETSMVLQQKDTIMKEALVKMLDGMPDNVKKFMESIYEEEGMAALTAQATVVPVTPEIVNDDIDPAVERKFAEGDWYCLKKKKFLTPIVMDAEDCIAKMPGNFWCEQLTKKVKDD